MSLPEGKSSVTLSAEEKERIAQWCDDNRDEPAVYFVRCGEFIKIGWSASWHKRLSQIRVNNPYEIEVLLVIGRPEIFEKTMHRQFASAHHRGEWFRDTPEIREYIESRKDECWHRAGRRK